MNTEICPRVRNDLEFLPAQHGGEQLIIIRDQLGLVQEGKALPLPLYSFMAMLDGTKTLRDIQMMFIRQRGGTLVGLEEIESLLEGLDESFLLDTEKYRKARKKRVEQFGALDIRPCTHCGQSYPENPLELKNELEKIVSRQTNFPKPSQKITALVAPHIDIMVGAEAYGNAYGWLKNYSPSRVILVGVGHQLRELFCLTDKNFKTPLGVASCDKEAVRNLREAGGLAVSENDFAHRAEHSIEFQVIFLQHILGNSEFTIVPLLCGSAEASLPEYSRNAYLDKAGPFLASLKEILNNENQNTLIVAGIDFSHIGPKFGHDRPAIYLETQSKPHDQALLEALCHGDANAFWEESIRVKDQFNVCGFSAMACLLEIMPPSQGQILSYQCWHEEPTQSAVSFAAVGFVKK